MLHHIAHSSLIQLYKSLTPSAHRMWRKWLRSPLHVANQEVVQLFHYLDTRRQLSSVSLQKQRIFSALYPGIPYDDGKLRQLLHLGLKALEAFVGYADTVSDQQQVDLRQVKALLTRGQLSRSQQQLDHLLAHSSESPHRSWQHHEHAYQLEQIQFDLIGTSERMADNNLPKLFAHLSAYFVISTLRYACIAASHRSLARQAYEIPLLEGILAAIAQGTWAEEPAVQLYYHAYLALSEPTPTHLRALQEQFFAHRATLPRNEQRDILLMALNACIRQLNTDDEGFAQQAFTLYRLGLDSELLLDEGRLSRFNYKNIVSIALKTQAFQWAETFIEQYAEHLDPTYRDSYQSFNLARLHFARGEYRMAKQLLIQIEYDDVFFSLGARMMLLKIYYETAEWDALDSFLMSFEQFLRRQADLGYHREVYQNIIGLVRHMLDVPAMNAETVATLRQAILGTQPLAERTWLLAQLVERA